MGQRADILSYPVRGALAKDLFIAVQSTLEPVSRVLAGLRFTSAPGPVAARLTVVEDPAAPQKRFVLPEYYTRIEWLGGTQARVETNGATGSIYWSGHASDILEAELRIFPEGAPESLGMFLRLVSSILLPSRRALLVHASAVIVEAEGIIFLGDSGAGKTTTARRAGREGALRIADDLTILHVGIDGSVRVEPCNFDRGGRLPGRALGSWPVRAAYDLRKGALATREAGRVKNPLATWCGAILSSTGPPNTLDSLLSLASVLSRGHAPRVLEVSPVGSVLTGLTARAQPGHAPLNSLSAREFSDEP